MKQFSMTIALIALATALAESAASACPEGSLELATACGVTASAGCCNENRQLEFCWESKLCLADCPAMGESCGWTGSAYGCGASETADPSGLYDLECCVPDCAGVECGDNGCGGVCGLCAGNEACTDGECVCIPDCDGKDCGDDGCDGSCGDCPDFFILDSSQFECTSEQVCVCHPYCTGRECGADGCGGSCGTCSGDEWCIGGQCQVPSCEPFCDYRDCGLDPDCGISCGECGLGYQCNVWGQCIGASCTPTCVGRECGSDGCGGVCGECTAPETCVVNTCVACVPDCTDTECGDNGCGGVCGECAEGFGCQAGMCVELVCTPNCEGKDCGDNGCGGVCGMCKSPLVCRANQTCGTPCTPDCEGKDCGDDGCDGVCGECGDEENCEDGLCVAIIVENDATVGQDTAQDEDVDRPVEDEGGVTDTGTGQVNDIGTSTCPTGAYLYYGQCISVPTDDAEDGGCTAGNIPVAPWLPLSLLGLAVLLKRRYD